MGALVLFPDYILAQAEKVKHWSVEKLASLGSQRFNNLGGSMGTDPMWSLTTHRGFNQNIFSLSVSLL